MSRFRRILNSFKKTGFIWKDRGGVMNIPLSSHDFATALISQIIDVVADEVASAELRNDDKANFLTFARFKAFFDVHGGELVHKLVNNGIVHIKISEDGSLEISDIEAHYSISTSTFDAYGKSDADMLRPYFKYVNNILNASDTSIRRLGNLIIMSPQHDREAPIMLTDDEVKEEEKSFSQEYGGLADQAQVKIMRNPYNITPVSLAGTSIQYDQRLQTAIKVICGKLRVPYELVPSAIVGNANQTGVYQEQAIIRLFNTVDNYMTLFLMLAEQMGLSVSYELKNKPKKNLKTEWEAKKLMVESVRMMLDGGLINMDIAKEIISNEI